MGMMSQQEFPDDYGEFHSQVDTSNDEIGNRLRRDRDNSNSQQQRGKQYQGPGSSSQSQSFQFSQVNKFLLFF